MSPNDNIARYKSRDVLRRVVGYFADFMERGWVSDQPQGCG